MGFVKEKDFFLFCLVYHSILILCIEKENFMERIEIYSFILGL